MYVQTFTNDDESMTIDSSIDFAFTDDYDKDLSDTLNTLLDFDGDVSADFNLAYSKKKFDYEFSSSYAFGGGFSNKIWSLSTDELSVENSLSYSLEWFELQSSISVSSQIFDVKEDSLLASSFMSPGNINWALGVEFSFSKWLDATFALNVASVEAILFINQSIYDIQDVTTLNEVDKGKYFYTLVGVDVLYALKKSIGDNVEIESSGKLFFPGEGKMFSEEWLRYFKVEVTNEISYSLDKFNLSLQSKFSYNNYLGRSIQFYNKLAIGVAFH